MRGRLFAFAVFLLVFASLADAADVDIIGGNVYDDAAILFSENGQNTIEIAQNSFNYACPVCEGDSCPLETGVG